MCIVDHRFADGDGRCDQYDAEHHPLKCLSHHNLFSSLISTEDLDTTSTQLHRAPNTCPTGSASAALQPTRQRDWMRRAIAVRAPTQGRAMLWPSEHVYTEGVPGEYACAGLGVKRAKQLMGVGCV
jgi:hypothetical protein